jgi:hypothetical protein
MMNLAYQTYQDYQDCQAYSVRSVHDYSEWQACFHAISKQNLTQSYAYGEAKAIAEHWHINRLIFERAGMPVAICQILEKRVAGLRILSRINRGPLFLDDHPSYAIKDNVFRLLRQQWKYFTGGVLLIAPALAPSAENRTILLQNGFKERKATGWCSALIDLQPEPHEMEKALSSQWRNRLKAARRCGLELESSRSANSVQWLLEMHNLNMKTKGFRGPSDGLITALHAANPNDFVVLTALHQGQPLAVMGMARFGATAEYYIGWFGEAGRKFNAGNFLYWNAVLEMKKAGCRWFDVGGYHSSDSYGRFKQSMRGIEYKLIGEWVAF